MLAMSNLRKKFFRRTLRLDLAHFGENNQSELLSRFYQRLRRALFAECKRCSAGDSRTAENDRLSCRRCLGQLAVAAVFAFMCSRDGYLISRLAKSLKRANRRIMEEITQLYGILGEVFSTIKVVQAFTRERRETGPFSSQ